MILISHRGNIIGPNKNRENTPSYIDVSIMNGYDVEVDINYVNKKFYLGHDSPDIEINERWIENRKCKLWFHCKNLDAATKLSELNEIYGEYRFFCHTADPIVLTSSGHVWVHDLSINLTSRSIIPLLSNTDIINYKGTIVYAICTDYISFADFNLKQRGLYK